MNQEFVLKPDDFEIITVNAKSCGQSVESNYFMRGESHYRVEFKFKNNEAYDRVKDLFYTRESKTFDENIRMTMKVGDTVMWVL